MTQMECELGKCTHTARTAPGEELGNGHGALPGKADGLALGELLGILDELALGTVLGPRLPNIKFH